MSKIAEKLRAATSKRAGASALLVLEDGTVFAGTSCGAPGEAFGEICFNTSMEGYLEIVTDLSYACLLYTSLRLRQAPALRIQRFPSRPQSRSAALQANCRHLSEPR